MAVKNILEIIPSKRGLSTLKIAPAVPPECCEKQVFSTSQSVSKTIKCYYVISYKTLFWDNISTFSSPSERRKKIKRPFER